MQSGFDYQIAIIGGGPAGATLGRLLPKGLSAILIDKKRAKGGFEKPCGGLLAPDAQKALSKYEITLPKSILVDPQIFSVKTIDLASGLVRHYQRCYINLDRHKLDMWLLSMIRPSVRRVTGVCDGVKRIDGGFEVSWHDGDHKHSFTCKYVVGADGASSVVRSSLFKAKQLRRYTAIQQWFPEENSRPFYSCIFDPETTDCCSWSISKDDYFIFGGAFPQDNCRERFERQKEKLAALGAGHGGDLGGFLGNALAEIDPALFLARAEGFPVGGKEHILGDIKDFLQVFALRLPIHVVLCAEERRIGVFRSFRHQFSPPSLRMRLISSDSTNACTRVRSCPELPLLYRRSTERTGQFFSSAIMWLTSARSKPQ